MLAMHGANFLANKTTDHIQIRAIKASRITSLLTPTLFMGCGIWLYYHVSGYAIIETFSHQGPSNPLHKMVEQQAGAWFANYKQFPWTMGLPILGILGALFSALWVKSKPKLAFVSSAASILGIIATVGISMFPFLLPSSTHPNHSLTVWDSSSSQLTLFIMLIATLIFFPLILAYTAWVYRVLRGKITAESIFSQEDVAY
jgi:cytochrome d ubiquinol oxidase subunit II